jgi:hypothetical protein
MERHVACETVEPVMCSRMLQYNTIYENVIQKEMDLKEAVREWAGCECGLDVRESGLDVRVMFSGALL